MYIVTLAFVAAAIVLGAVVGKPQYNLGIGVPEELLSPSEGSLQGNSGQSGLIKLQLFVNRGKGTDGGGLVKVQESNVTFTIPGESNRLCPVRQLMYEEDGKCYTKGRRATYEVPFPCSDDQFFEFEERDDKPGYGDCYCVEFRGSTTRPVVYWPERNRCYWLYDQGPCKKGEWLVFSNISDKETRDSRQRAVSCTRRSCPENVVDPYNQFPNFWFPHGGKCYQTGTESKDICENSNKPKIYFSTVKPEPSCYNRRPIIPVKSLASGAGSLSCKAGLKKLPNGECKRVINFD